MITLTRPWGVLVGLPVLRCRSCDGDRPHRPGPNQYQSECVVCGTRRAAQ